MAADSSRRPVDDLETLARKRFCDLGQAELALLRAAPKGEWTSCGPSANYQDSTNDPAKADSWGPEREIRASLIRWLCVDREAARARGERRTKMRNIERRTKMRKGLIVSLFILLASGSALSQEKWTRIEKTDALRDTSYVSFALVGKFLEAPPQVSPTLCLSLIVFRAAGERSMGILSVSSWMHTFQSVRFWIHYQGRMTNQMCIKYRLDDGKVKDHVLFSSSNFSGFFMVDYQLEDLLYIHKAARKSKEKTSVPARKAVIQVSEFVGGHVTMEFDFPDPTEVADACGLYHYFK